MRLKKSIKNLGNPVIMQILINKGENKFESIGTIFGRT